MRPLILSFLSLALCAESPIPIQAPIRSVRLHPDEAWIMRLGTVRVPGPGTHQLQLGQLPGNLQQEDLRVLAKGPEGTRLGEIRVGPDRHIAPETAESKALLARLEALHQRKLQLEAQQRAADKAGQFLDSVQYAVPGQGGNPGSTMPPNTRVADLSRELEARFGELAAQSQARAQELERVQKEMAGLEAEWQKLRGKLDINPNPSQVMVELVSPGAGEVELEVSYRTPQARWKPSYEARLSPDGRHLELALFADVTQSSGEAWDGVGMELSNSHPSRVQEMPKFSSSPRIGWAPPPPPYSGASATVEVVGTAARVDQSETKTATNFSSDSLGSVKAPYRPPEPKPQPALQAPAASLEEVKGLARTWRLEGSKEVPSDGDSHRFLVARQDLESQPRIVVAPRLDHTAYQVVRFDAPSRLPMFPGAPVLRSIGAMRMGQGSLSIPPADQPFELNFGPYQGLRATLLRVSEKRPFRMIKVTETRQNQKTRVQEEVIANGERRAWELHERITLANDTDEPLDVEVQDRIIRSIHESVKVVATPDTAPGAEPRSPFVQAWTRRLPPKATVDLPLGVLITAPKQGDLTGLKDLGLDSAPTP